LALAVLAQPLRIERVKPLAKIVEIAEHDKELAHKDPRWFRLMASQPDTRRRSLGAGKPLPLIQNSGYATLDKSCLQKSKGQGGRDMPDQHLEYDLIVIGSGPAGQKAALAAAKQRRVALIERQQVVGGFCLHTGTIPSKALREAVLYFTGHRLHSLYGTSYRAKDRIVMDDLTFRVQHVIRCELDAIASQLRRNNIDLYYGTACFASPHTVDIEGLHTTTRLRGKAFIIAVGSRPARPAYIPFTPGSIIDSDGILELSEIPRSMVVVGAGIIGCEYGSIFSTLGVEITLIDQRSTLLDFVDREIVDSLIYHMRAENVALRLEETVAKVFIDEQDRIVTELKSGKRILSQTLLFAVG
jgi:NAD(P) transhydrogenase